MKQYNVHSIPAQPLHSVDFNKAEQGLIRNIRPESSDHHPSVKFALLHDSENLYLHYTVDDSYVRIIHKGFQVPVYKDSCVEFFVKPKKDCGYFNFELNAGGSMLVTYIEDHHRTAGVLKKATPLPPEIGAKIEITHSLPHTVEPEITTPITWTLSLKIPFVVMEHYTGNISCSEGATWRGNFYKCGDETSHPHWLSWSPVKELNFHAPDDFGRLCF